MKNGHKLTLAGAIFGVLLIILGIGGWLVPIVPGTLLIIGGLVVLGVIGVRERRKHKKSAKKN